MYMFFGKFKKLYLFAPVVLVFLAIGTAFAQSDEQKLNDLSRQIQEYNAQITRLQNQASTLSNQVAQFNAQIRLTELKIDQTQEQISLLGGRIDQLESSLGSLNEAFGSRVEETYKLARLDDSPLLLMAASNVGDAVSKFHYLKKIQEADKKLIERLDNAKNTYSTQKVEFEALEQTLNSQKKELDEQKAAKANLLAVTKNDEKRYQELLSAARAEFEAIQAIIAGRGDETEVGRVNAGERIATVIQGPSCNSNGAHLHFIVSVNGNVQNPFSYLKPGVEFSNCSGPGACSEGDPFNPSGAWEWPLASPIKFTQGYGNTWAVRNSWVGRIYSFHNGIDINNPVSPDVKAVQSGTLFRGSFAGSAGCRLRYVRVDHEGSDIDTFYLHINY